MLLTTNETLGRLNSAVARPGRCAAAIEFAPFTADEAAAWLGGDGGASGGTLAELYARKAGRRAARASGVGVRTA